MFELIKQSMFTGIGLAMLTRDKLTDLSKQIAEKADLSEAQAMKFREELIQKAEKARADLESEIDHRIDHAFVQLGLVKAEVKKATESARGSLEGLIDRQIDKALERLRVARREDIESLVARVEMLEKKA
jgi:polyhydroxyalkanoate synthesis regulator phasin